MSDNHSGLGPRTPGGRLPSVTGLADAPLDALRAALVALGRQLAAAGAAPLDVEILTITCRQPAAIHLARVDADFALRETFGGRRPTITLGRADHDGVQIVAGLRPPSPQSTDIVWSGFTRAALARAYSTRGPVADVPALFASWRRDGEAFRTAHLTAELAYGPSRSETLDLYLPTTPRHASYPLWIFIHGGFWQAMDKAHNAHLGAGMLRSGIAVAMLNYTLAPEATLAEIVTQMQRAIAFLSRDAAALDCDPSAFHLSGHSAGGHLAAMIATLPEGRLIQSCLPLSGLFDVEPLSHLPMGPILSLNSSETIAALSPGRHRSHPHIRIATAVGGLETSEFQRQSRDYAAHAQARCHVISGRNHFDLLETLNGGELLDLALMLARGS